MSRRKPGAIPRRKTPYSSKTESDDVPFENDNWHREILEGIDPADERAYMYETRQRAKKMHGFTEEELDALYGEDSRKPESCHSSGQRITNPSD